MGSWDREHVLNVVALHEAGLLTREEARQRLGLLRDDLDPVDMALEEVRQRVENPHAYEVPRQEMRTEPSVAPWGSEEHKDVWLRALNDRVRTLEGRGIESRAEALRLAARVAALEGACVGLARRRNWEQIKKIQDETGFTPVDPDELRAERRVREYLESEV